MKNLGIGDTVVDPNVGKDFKTTKFSREGVVVNIVNKRSHGPGVVVRYNVETEPGKTCDFLYTLDEASQLGRA